MSSKIVRDAFGLAFETQFPTLNLQQTDNEEPDRKTLPEQWSTIDYQASGEERVSLGKTACWRETGVIIPVVYVKAGSGNTDVLVLIELVRAFFRDWVDPSAKIRITGVSPPDTGDASDGRWYAGFTSLSYIYDTYV